MKTRLIISALLLAFSLWGCKLGQKYVKPQMAIPPTLENGHERDTFSIADLAWWEIYNDSILFRLINHTLEHNKDLRIADARIKELAARKRVELAGLFPTVNGQAYVQKEGLNYGGDNFKNDPEEGLKASLSWELDLWGNLRWTNDRGKALLMESVENRRGLTISIIAQVAQAYFELVALDNELSIVTRTLAARKESVRLAKIRFEGGLTSETAYQQAKMELARTATHIPIIERDIALKENEISFLAGSFPSAVERSRQPGHINLPEDLPVGLPSTLLERRPDLRAAEQRLIAANAAVGVAYTNRFPRLTLTATGGLESDEFSDFFKSPMHFLSASLLGPIFDFGRRQGAYRAQQAVYEQECYNYEKTVLGAFMEVRNAIVDYNKIQEIYESMAELEQASKTTMELAQLQYINGVIGYIDVLDAQRSYFDAQINLSNAIRNKELVIVRLYKALGGGWQQ